MLGALIFIPLLIAVCFYAIWRGGPDERVVALTCLAGTAATLLTVSPLTERYVGLEEGMAWVDFTVLAGFVAVALRSSRFWPLWVAGFQLTTALGHGFKVIDRDLLPGAYGAALQFWAYPILIVLAVGTWREHRRQRRSDSCHEQTA